MKHFYQLLIFTVCFINISCIDVVEDNYSPQNETKNNFTFFVDTLGDGYFSVVYDAIILNKSLIYAVGEFYLKDSTGDYQTRPYCFAKWDGSFWEYKRLYYDSNFVLSYQKSIIPKSDGGFYLAGGSVFSWDGVSNQTKLVFSRLSLPNQMGTIDKLWGVDQNNVYGIGHAGTLVKYDGVSWKNINTYTNLSFQDIWGAKDPVSGRYEILAVASEGVFGLQKVVFQIQGNKVTELSDIGINGSTMSVWFIPQKQYYIAGDGMWRKEEVNSNSPWNSFASNVTSYFLYSMRGQAENDIVASGSYGELLHYNGRIWKSFRTQNGFYNLELLDVDIRDDVIIAVGRVGNRACVVRGYRN